MPITPFKTVVFICTGNFYRSRFSEHLFNALAKKRAAMAGDLPRLEGQDGGWRGPHLRVRRVQVDRNGNSFRRRTVPFNFRRPTWKTPIWSWPSRRPNTTR